MLNKLNPIGHFAMLSLLIGLLAGCSSVPMPKGSSKGYSSVRFITPNAPLHGDDAPAAVEGHRMIKEAIAFQMEEHGLKVVEQDADLIAAHLIIIQNNVSTTYNNQHYGLQDFTEILDLAHDKGTGKNYPEQVQKRALIIDLIDAKTHKLVYRDYFVGGTIAHLPEQERKETIDNAVAQTLQKFFN